MNVTHSSLPHTPFTHSKETRKNIGSIPSQDRFIVGEPNLPQFVTHFHFVNDGSNKVRISLHNEIKNIKAVFLDCLYVDLSDDSTPFRFSYGVKFTKQTDYFYPEIRHGSNMSPDNTIWNRPVFANTSIGQGDLVLVDERSRCLKAYRSAYTFSQIEVTLVDEDGVTMPGWREINMDLRFETMDWQ